MAVKRAREKKNKLKELYAKSIKIKCCYCTINDSCKYRKSKEESENMGITTYCSLTPNRPKNAKKNKYIK
ncbi:hypothetical protein [Clostridium felsineum]|uniref:Uncharacterized protein n=1 Tax=Clostridium felsineum TaxID=36839 RepID=A0A1S8L1M9_9CLOT|nr:hypothetical protein [Clostridium felsineum]MCR3758662.1 hypothetical protein [Clostridium felsineum]URZ09237.1 hypothetical protein CLROS_046530 [Clostridium felsineum]URZ13923.1 hypothetical protein CROST_047010 [Clostridium felsineum]URZ18532.1 hypothetical protein CLFE_046200 [Clostridium felsineum DSM 794]